ncbi:MAG: acetyl-CoA acetyltransferase [Acidimicrobiales bacterium]
MTTRVAVVGVAESDYGKLPHMSQLQVHAQAARRALDDAGLTMGDVDCLMTGGAGGMMPVVALAEYFGIQPRVCDSTGVGGSMWEFLVHHAMASLQTGQCEVALVVYGSKFRTDSGSSLGTGQRFSAARGPVAFEDPFGLPLVGRAGLVASRHMFEFGTTSEQLAEVAVAMRTNASLNPKAMHREPITIEDVVGSRLICDPLHKLDCCIVTDGGGAIVLTLEDRARDRPKAPVFVLGAGQSVTHETMAGWTDFGLLAARRSSEDAYRQAGLGPSDVDVLMVYDSYTITVLLQLEALGFCGRGESGPFVEGGRLAHSGTLPTNTDGGGLSNNHPGMRGIFLMIEAVRQLRGESTAQVAGVEVALANGTGGPFSSCGTVILGSG